MIRKSGSLTLLVAGLPLLALGAAPGGGAASVVRAPIRYEISDLGTFGGPTSVALGINENGQVVGSADLPTGQRRAYIWEDGVMTELSPLPGFPVSEAWDINNHGVAVGVSISGGEGAVMWKKGAVTYLGSLGGQSSALAINDAEQVVGTSETAGSSHAFLWEAGVITDLGTLGGSYSIAWDINENGQIVGGSFTGFGEHAFLWDDGVMQDLGTLGGEQSVAFGVNDSAAVVGRAQSEFGSKTQYAFIWVDGTMTNLGALGGFDGSSRGAEINNSGQVIGRPQFLYDPRFGVLDFDAMLPLGHGWSFLTPRAMNDEGQIVGSGFGPSGLHAFLMNPVPQPLVPTLHPVATAILALLILTAGIAISARGRGARAV
jgi:probable HAF family extracellular repeat protein